MKRTGGKNSFPQMPYTSFTSQVEDLRCALATLGCPLCGRLGRTEKTADKQVIREASQHIWADRGRHSRKRKHFPYSFTHLPATYPRLVGGLVRGGQADKARFRHYYRFTMQEHRSFGGGTPVAVRCTVLWLPLRFLSSSLCPSTCRRPPWLWRPPGPAVHPPSAERTPLAGRRLEPTWGCL